MTTDKVRQPLPTVCTETTEPSFMVKNGESLPVKSIHKAPAGSTAEAVEATGRLTNGRRATDSAQTPAKEAAARLPATAIRQTAPVNRRSDALKYHQSKKHNS